MAPASRAARILNGMPPIGPTTPSWVMVPVPATNRPPVSSPGVSLSTTASANINPADGPPMSPRLIVMSPACGSTPGRTPSRPCGRSGLEPSTTAASRCCPSRRKVIVTDCPGAVLASASATASGEDTGRPDTATSSSPTSSVPAAGESLTSSPTTTRVGSAQLGQRGHLGVGLGRGELVGVVLLHLLVGAAGREDPVARDHLAGPDAQ